MLLQDGMVIDWSPMVLLAHHHITISWSSSDTWISLKITAAITRSQLIFTILIRGKPLTLSLFLCRVPFICLGGFSDFIWLMLKFFRVGILLKSSASPSGVNFGYWLNTPLSPKSFTSALVLNFSSCHQTPSTLHIFWPSLAFF